jgi:hypothetical protein
MIGKSQNYSKSNYLIPGVGEKIISQRTMPPQLWKQRKNSKHSQNTSCYWLIIGKLHTSHGKFHYEWNSRELLPRRHLGHQPKKLHNSLRKLHKVLLGSSLDFHAGDAYELLPRKIAQWIKIERVTQKASVKLDKLHSGWKIGIYPKSGMQGTCTIDENLDENGWNLIV